LELEERKATIEELMPIIGGDAYKKLLQEGDFHAGILSIGQVIGRIDKYPSVKEIITDIINDAEIILEKIKQYWQPEKSI
jgi:NAD(P)H-dependent flavin oxidoreductase YrpB (nitropropane dioxygenase family)